MTVNPHAPFSPQPLLTVPDVPDLPLAPGAARYPRKSLVNIMSGSIVHARSMAATITVAPGSMLWQVEAGGPCSKPYRWQYVRAATMATVFHFYSPSTSVGLLKSEQR